MEEFVLILQEVGYHPNSYLTKLDSKFESPSIIRVTKKEELRRVTKPPLFDEKYLVIFDDLKMFQDNYAFLSLKIMFPVLHVETKTALDDAVFYMKERSIPYRIFCNLFSAYNKCLGVCSFVRGGLYWSCGIQFNLLGYDNGCY